jgi:general stress protein 26
MPSTPDDRERLWSLIKGIRFAMFTTRHSNGHLHSRPMTLQNAKIDEDAALWFFMSRGSEPVDDIQREPTVNVAFAHTDKDSYVSVSGEAALVHDPAKVREFWSKINEAWFPGGPDDPELALVKVSITHADYWDVKESKPVQLFKMLKAAATGTRPTGMGEHGQVRM